jgi:hypothetical protein
MAQGYLRQQAIGPETLNKRAFREYRRDTGVPFDTGAHDGCDLSRAAAPVR